MKHVRASQKQHDRRGSVLLVVIALLGMLLLAGIAFYTMASQENTAAEYFADAAKATDPELEDDTLFDYGLEQLILGPPGFLTKSALYGKRHSLVPNMMGFGINAQLFDRSPYNGQGIILVNNGGGTYSSTNASAFLNSAGVIVNFSAAANGGTVGNLPAIQPDVDYTYPDINNPYLAYIGTTPTSAGSPDYPVIIPSFLPPTALRSPTGTGILADWATNPLTATNVLRPHPSHVNPKGTARFLSAATTNSIGQPVGPFPFTQHGTLNLGVFQPGYNAGLGAPATVSLDVDNDNDGVKEGIWMDLDYPVQQLADGRYFIPLFSYTVIDADGLMNLNTSGNLTGASPANVPGGNNMFLSFSNMGLSRSEINPEWAFLADPQNGTYTSNAGSDIQSYLTWWGGDTTATVSRTMQANMELLNLCWGNVTFSQGSGSFNHPNYASPPYSPDTYIAGRWSGGQDFQNYKTLVQNGPGAGGGIQGNLIPYPGTTGVDDDVDVSVGMVRQQFWSPNLGAMNLTANIFSSAFTQPLDYWGNGSATTAGNNGMQTYTLTSSNVNSPPHWPAYSSGYQYTGSYGGSVAQTYYTPPATVPYYTWSDGSTFVTSQLFQSPIGNGNVDEADEAVAEPGLANPNDAMFTVDEQAGLSLPPADIQSASITSRLQSLMPFNLRDNLLAQTPPAPRPGASYEYSIKPQFTVYSYDRTQHGYPQNYNRTWEYNADTNNNSHLEFPPVYNTANATNGAILNGPTTEPFRWQLRQLLTSEQNNSQTNWMQLRLDLNNYLATTTYDFNLQRTVPVYRAPTPHPLGLGSGAVPTGYSQYNLPAFPPAAGSVEQEFYARFDRQQMARDIFVLLYTLGMAADLTNGTLPTAATVYPPQLTDATTGQTYYPLVDQMAQFAVNYVDAIDPDNVMTRFEYPADPAQGWSLDDNPYTIDQPAVRREVWGVESQQLTISEAQVIYTPTVVNGGGVPTDENATQYSDKFDHYFTYIELQNVSPFPISLNNGASNATSGVWQIQMIPNANPNSPYGNGTGAIPVNVERRLTLIDGQVNAGQQFTIGSVATVQTKDNSGVSLPTPIVTRDPNLLDASGNPVPSFFKVDASTNGANSKTAAQWASFDPEAPVGATAALDYIPPTGVYPSGVGANYMDLLNFSQGAASPSFLLSQGQSVTDPTQQAYYDDGTQVSTTTTPGDFVHVNTLNGGTSVTFILRRRANPHRTPPDVNTGANAATTNPEAADNPWVEVDRFTVSPNQGYQQFTVKFNDSTTAGSITNDFTNTPINSWERQEGFKRFVNQQGQPQAAYPYSPNSLGMTNYNTQQNNGGYFNIWQHHFDRDFSSAYDLLWVPLYGPNNVTNYLFDSGLQKSTLPTTFGLSTGIASTAHQVIMHPGTDINRWYRLLEFVEVPTRTQLAMQARLTSDFQLAGPRVPGPRVPGAINLNTVRHRGVFAGLIDDPTNPSAPMYTGHLNLQYSSAMPQTMLYDNYENTSNPAYTGTITRDWWSQIILARDGVHTAGGAAPTADPVSGLYVPGVPGTQPFRSLSYADDGANSIEHTILRRLPMDAQTGLSFQQQRQFFEARTQTDALSGAPAVDAYSRYRLLRKVANNSTTRSNVFIVWMTVQYYEAVKNGNGEFSIGDALSGSPQHRGFFVVDRSLPEMAYDVQTHRYDFRKFIAYRKTLQ